MIKLNFIRKIGSLQLYEYIDEESPFIKYKHLLASKNPQGLRICSSLKDGVVMSYIVRKKLESLGYIYNSVGNVKVNSIIIYPDDYSESPLSQYHLEFLRYFKKRSVAIMSYCASNGLKIVDNRLCGDICFSPKKFSSLEELLDDLAKDYIFLDKMDKVKYDKKII